MVAVLSSVARTEARSVTTGNGRRRQDRPSLVVRRTVPARPTSQQTDGDGEDPATGISFTPVDWEFQVLPPSLECCTSPAIPTRHWLTRFEETTMGTSAV